MQRKQTIIRDGKMNAKTKPKIVTAFSSPIHKPKFGEARMLGEISRLLIDRGNDVKLLSMGEEPQQVIDGKYNETVLKAPEMPKVAQHPDNAYGPHIDSIMKQFRMQRNAFNVDAEARIVKQLRELQPSKARSFK